MKFSYIFTVYVSLFISICYCDPNVKKGELIESIINKKTEGNYAEAINLFGEIGNLAKSHTIDLSDKEQKLFFDCYQYRRMQMRKELVNVYDGSGLKILNLEAVKQKSLFYGLIKDIIEDLMQGSSNELNRQPEHNSHYDYFLKKYLADKDYFQAWYKEDRINRIVLNVAYEEYQKALEGLQTFLGDADVTVLDACLGFSSAKLESSTIVDGYDHGPPNPCETAQNCLSKGLNASSDSNPDLIPLSEFTTTYCKPDAPNILKNKNFLRMD